MWLTCPFASFIPFSFTLEQGKNKSFQPAKSLEMSWQKIPGAIETWRDPMQKKQSNYSIYYVKYQVLWFTTTNRIEEERSRVQNATGMSTWSWNLCLKIVSLSAITSVLQSPLYYEEAVASHTKIGWCSLQHSVPFSVLPNIQWCRNKPVSATERAKRWSGKIRSECGVG